MSDFDQLLWTCHFCGLETPKISEHLQRAHDRTAEDVVRLLDERDRRRLAAEQMLLARQEIAEATRSLFRPDTLDDE